MIRRGAHAHIFGFFSLHADLDRDDDADADDRGFRDPEDAPQLAVRSQCLFHCRGSFS